jgi:hypothetical protein
MQRRSIFEGPAMAWIQGIDFPDSNYNGFTSYDAPACTSILMSGTVSVRFWIFHAVDVCGAWEFMCGQKSYYLDHTWMPADRIWNQNAERTLLCCVTNKWVVVSFLFWHLFYLIFNNGPYKVSLPSGLLFSIRAWHYLSNKPSRDIHRRFYPRWEAEIRPYPYSVGLLIIWLNFLLIFFFSITNI